MRLTSGPRSRAPTLILSREDGAQVIDDAKAGKSATLRLEATLEPAEAYQLIAYLPGKGYGTPADEQIVLVNHTDGPSITQDNGALGLLAIVKYFSHIPQEHRPRTLTIYLDCRHYMPGMEAAHSASTWLRREPQASEKIVGMMHGRRRHGGSGLPHGQSQRTHAKKAVAAAFAR
ncbi:MAG: hypothetical protein IIA11_06425 [Proteobacteria bacterium]|nr:hypothetical protein [Pseudomonadota bacterium]